MPQTVTPSTRVPGDFRAQVDEFARVLGRDCSWVVKQAVRRFVETEMQFIAAVQQRREDKG